MKRLTIPGCLFLLLTSCTTEAANPKSLVAVAKDNIEKAKKYHELNNKAKLSQAEVQDFIKNWIESCDALAKTMKQPLQLTMGKDGDPGCYVQETPPAPMQPQSPAPTGPQVPRK